MSELKKFEDWFAARCDGDWEHSAGIKITTLDNPGWSLEVRLHDTCMEGHTLEGVESIGAKKTGYVVGPKTGNSRPAVAHGTLLKCSAFLSIGRTVAQPSNSRVLPMGVW